MHRYLGVSSLNTAKHAQDCIAFVAAVIIIYAAVKRFLHSSDPASYLSIYSFQDLSGGISFTSTIQCAYGYVRKWIFSTEAELIYPSICGFDSICHFNKYTPQFPQGEIRSHIFLVCDALRNAIFCLWPEMKWSTKTMRYTKQEFATMVLGIVVYVADIGADLWVANKYFHEGQYLWCALTLATGLLSSLVVQYFSYTWFKDDGTHKPSWISSLHLLQAGIFTR